MVRIDELMATPTGTPMSPHPIAPGVVRGRIIFDGVRFRYPGSTFEALRGVDLTIEAGQTIALVGETGAGKSTIVKLVARFYDATAGRVLVDGVPITELELDAFRRQLGYVPQEAFLFSGTIRDNIAYGRPGATEDDILEAARATYVDRFVHSLPDGYDTHIDEEGSNLSAGERQLITIARAFLSDPELLILDEATSSVDTRTELLLQHAMAALRTDRTSFVIAHRLSTIRDADLILVMEDGAIVEQGTHESLLVDEGAYARLYNAQFVAPEESAVA
jgi:ATP-binding cassette subfamily B protein